ncbi:DUF4260 domain-containing protein [bacterium]|nr:DUF4260 domain-containing protein [bacterium]MCB2179296.1 DUF4260 domain-containing protein [bacterium]
MKNVIRLEELGMFLFGILAFTQLGYAWWWFLVLLFTPDLSMIGYALSPVVGAWTYNIVHHKGIALIVYVLGVWLAVPWVQLAGVILFTHSSMDRIFGYGLKYPDSFQHTHLGMIGGK